MRTRASTHCQVQLQLQIANKSNSSSRLQTTFLSLAPQFSFLVWYMKEKTKGFSSWVCWYLLSVCSSKLWWQPLPLQLSPSCVNKVSCTFCFKFLDKWRLVELFFVFSAVVTTMRGMQSSIKGRKKRFTCPDFFTSETFAGCFRISIRSLIESCFFLL